MQFLLMGLACGFFFALGAGYKFGAFGYSKVVKRKELI